MSAARGIALKVGATLAFGGMNVLIKLAGELPIGQIVFFRSLFALVPVLIVTAYAGDLARAVRTRKPHLHVVRGLLGTVSMFCYFTGITLLPLADSTAFSFVMPIFSVILAAILLREAVGAFCWAAVLAGFGGVLLMIEPHGGIVSVVEGGLSFGAAASIAGAFLAAFVVVFIRQMSASENSEAIVFYFMVTASVVSGCTLFFAWETPSPVMLLVLVLNGILGGIGQLCMTFAYRYAEPSVLAPFDYVAIVWAALFGYLVFSDLPAWQVVAGCGIVVVAGVVISLRERVRGQALAKPQSL